jgi:hypothetical protein
LIDTMLLYLEDNDAAAIGEITRTIGWEHRHENQSYQENPWHPRQFGSWQ